MFAITLAVKKGKIFNKTYKNANLILYVALKCNLHRTEIYC